MQGDDHGAPKQDAADQSHEESLEAALRKAKEKQNSARHKAEQYFSDWTNWVAIFTLIAVVAYTGITIVIAWIAFQQFRLGREQEQAQLRPYVVASPAPSALEVGNPLKTTVKLDNLGLTPVYRGKLFARFIPTAQTTIPASSLPECSQEDAAGPPGTAFGKTVAIPTQSDFSVTATQIKAIKDGKLAIVNVGRFCYSDIFGANHQTDFCIYWNKEDENGNAHYCQYMNGGN